MQRDSGPEAFGTTDLLAALLLIVAERAPRDDIALLEQAQSLARTIGWHPIWDVLLAALAQAIAAERIRRDAVGAPRLTPSGKRHLSALLTSRTERAPPALQPPLAKLKRKLAAIRISADRKPARRV